MTDDDDYDNDDNSINNTSLYISVSEVMGVIDLAHILHYACPKLFFSFIVSYTFTMYTGISFSVVNPVGT
jgi:hypothetical protein